MKMIYEVFRECILGRNAVCERDLITDVRNKLMEVLRGNQ